MITAIDIETHMITDECLTPKPVCVASSSAPLLLWSDWSPDCLSGHVVGHNIAFDLACIVAHRPALTAAVWESYFAGRVHDTMIATRLRDIATMGDAWPGGYSLATCAQRVLGRALEKGEDTFRLRYAELDGHPISQWPQEAIDYVQGDADATLALWRTLTEGQSERYVDEPRQTLKAWWLHLMTVWGMATDQPSVDEWRRTTEDQHRALELQLIDAGFVRRPRTLRTGRVEPASRDMARVRAAVEIALGDAAPRTDKGAVSTSADACEQAATASGDPTLRAFVEYSHLGKVLSTDIPLVSKSTIHARFTTPLATGRTSSSPNVQNLPRDGMMRRCIVPRPGKVFVQADVSGLELGTLAQVLLRIVGWSRLADDIIAGRDAHSVMGAAILSAREGATVDYDAFRARLKAGDKACKAARQLAKVPNFGIPGGLGARRLVDYARALYGVEITEEQARELKALHARTYPEHVEYFRWIDSQCYPCEDGERRATIVQLFSGRIRGRCRYTEACNTLFQGLGADVTGWMGALISRACYTRQPSIAYPGEMSPLLGSRLVNYIHDEFILESDPVLAPYAAEELAAVMHHAAKAWLPDIPLHAEPCIMDRWDKDAAPVRGADGMLTCWSKIQ